MVQARVRSSVSSIASQPPDSGEVRLEGRPLREEDLFHIGYLPEERGLLPQDEGR